MYEAASRYRCTSRFGGSNQVMIIADGDESSTFRAGMYPVAPVVPTLLKEALEGWGGGISVEEKNRYADDPTLLAPNEDVIAELTQRVKTAGENLGLYIYATKTKVMIVDRAGDLTDREVLSDFDKVKSFVYTYLGFTVKYKSALTY